MGVSPAQHTSNFKVCLTFTKHWVLTLSATVDNGLLTDRAHNCVCLSVLGLTSCLWEWHINCHFSNVLLFVTIVAFNQDRWPPLQDLGWYHLPLWRLCHVWLYLNPNKTSHASQIDHGSVLQALIAYIYHVTSCSLLNCFCFYTYKLCCTQKSVKTPKANLTSSLELYVRAGEPGEKVSWVVEVYRKPQILNLCLTTITSNRTKIHYNMQYCM